MPRFPGRSHFDPLFLKRRTFRRPSAPSDRKDKLPKNHRKYVASPDRITSHPAFKRNNPAPIKANETIAYPILWTGGIDSPFFSHDRLKLPESTLTARNGSYPFLAGSSSSFCCSLILPVLISSPSIPRLHNPQASQPERVRPKDSQPSPHPHSSEQMPTRSCLEQACGSAACLPMGIVKPSPSDFLLPPGTLPPAPKETARAQRL
jgi:hypothetical protein